MPPTPERGARNRRRILLVGGAALAAIVAVVVLAATWAPLRRQVLLSVSQRPTPYAELYFSDFSALPATVEPGRSYAVPYTIVSHEGRTEDMTVSAVTISDGTTTPIGSRTVRLRDGGRVSGAFLFTPPQPHAIYRVVISLPGGQSISWRISAP